MAIESRIELPDPPARAEATETLPRAEPGRGYEVLELLPQLTAAADELPDLLHQFGTEQLSQVMRTALFLVGRMQQVATLITAEALIRGDVSRSDSANATRWVTGHVPAFDEPAEETGLGGDAEANSARAQRVPVEPATLRRIAAVAQECQHRKNDTVTAALRAGNCTVESARTTLAHADKVMPVLPGTEHDQVLAWYLSLDPSLGARGLTQLTRAAILAKFAPDQLDQEDAHLEDVETLTWSTTPTGMTRLVAELAPATAAMIKDAIMAGSAPRPVTTTDGSDGECATGTARRILDERTPAKRRADALLELVQAGARTTTGKGQLGSAATALITLSLDTLTTGVGTATTTTGDLLDATAARRLACDADLIPIVLGSRGEPLDVGRRERLVTKGLRAAVLFRDKGCSFPGCDRPPSFCEVHHVRPWWAGGVTSLINSAMLCCHHHRIVHRRGYTATVTEFGVVWDLTPGRIASTYPPAAYESA
ncbi:HNH endonuclease signature motif containing protein [Flexivirga caeni]|uniref:HNH endonuclease n=1 Tax=Flexivirga caeni TaxID=2294115 RepID=A0A3M9MIF3_9MICO|nr:HNH endonuclease signature motif containing protein [Flexivirga caeni]RNI25284.1 HNH endonuclease [Flexivirga caeni]